MLWIEQGTGQILASMPAALFRYGALKESGATTAQRQQNKAPK
jgi:hypothetical protein